MDFLKALTYNPNYLLIYQSVLFILVFSVFYSIYLLVFPRPKARNILLLLFSLYFYYKLSGLFVILLVLVASCDFLIGRAMLATPSAAKKKGLMMLSVFINLGILVFFKYANFLLGLIFGIFSEPAPWVVDVLMPIGISYYIFKTLTYTLDIYREEIDKAESSYWNYLLFVSFFPNILAGPISRARDLLPQFSARFSLSREMIGKGLFLILSGAFKKIVIADMLGANLVVRVFESPEYFNGFEILMAGYANLVQLYFDFSGYTDMVIGIALLLGFNILPNFNKPFLAQNLTDFWRRWHMTLSSWLRDYLFSPLSVSMRRAGTTGLVIAVMITFILCGFWHDALWTFIVWGCLHAIALGWDIATNKARTKFKKKNKGAWYKVISIVLTFHFLMFTFIVFSADSLEKAWFLITRIFTQTDFTLAGAWAEMYLIPLIVLVAGLLLHYLPMKWVDGARNTFVRLHWTLKVLAVAAAVFAIYQAFSTEAQAFKYLEF